jgi:serine/threonine protein kinase
VRGGVATDYGVVIGTPSYMSCEQAKGGNELDARTDIYSLGATLYHMVTGVLPFEGTSVPDVVVKLLTQPLVSPADRNPRVHPHVSALILKMMSKEPSQRHRTADEVEEDLTCLLEGRPLRYTLVAEPTVASPETSTDMSRPPSRGRGVAATPSPGSLGAKAASGARDTTSRKPPSRSVRRPSHQPGVPAIAFLSGSYRGKIIPITQPVTIVGRMPECDIQVLDSWFSRRHFIVHARDQGFEVEDLQSMNGTRINGQPVQRSPLRAGDKITVHETLMQFVFLTNEESEEELP